MYKVKLSAILMHRQKQVKLIMAVVLFRGQ